MRSDIENITSLEELSHHLDYVEMLIELFDKRGLDYSDLSEELKRLEKKKLELLKIMK
ncbi:MAG: hypothetical protein KJ847_03745 [Firmicutes bacterium]|nr:hypothetical protein [Bacillota bacterium]